jgi:hypothetical protein
MTAAAGAAITADAFDTDAAVAAPTHQEALAAPLHIGAVTLNVTDLDRVTVSQCTRC